MNPASRRRNQRTGTPPSVTPHGSFLSHRQALVIALPTRHHLFDQRSRMRHGHVPQGAAVPKRRSRYLTSSPRPRSQLRMSGQNPDIWEPDFRPARAFTPGTAVAVETSLLRPVGIRRTSPRAAGLVNQCGWQFRASRFCSPPAPVGLLVGLFVGLFCQPASGFWRFIAVDTPTAKSVQSPITTGSSCKSSDAGGGTRTPDTRIMIPLL
jgi:hypothetical protein